jgi:hypothetical protein
MVLAAFLSIVFVIRAELVALMRAVAQTPILEKAVKPIVAIALGLAMAAALAAADLPYAGKWKAQQGSAGPAKEIELVPNGTDGLTVKIISSNAVCEAKFDGADYPATGPQVPDGYTLAIKKSGPRAFEMVQKLKGKALYTSLFSVSENGKTLTETDSENSAGVRVKIVYDRP